MCQRISRFDESAAGRCGRKGPEGSGSPKALKETHTHTHAPPVERACVEWQKSLRFWWCCFPRWKMHQVYKEGQKTGSRWGLIDGRPLPCSARSLQKWAGFPDGGEVASWSVTARTTVGVPAAGVPSAQGFAPGPPTGPP